MLQQSADLGGQWAGHSARAQRLKRGCLKRLRAAGWRGGGETGWRSREASLTASSRATATCDGAARSVVPLICAPSPLSTTIAR